MNIENHLKSMIYGLLDKIEICDSVYKEVGNNGIIGKFSCCKIDVDMFSQGLH